VAVDFLAFVRGQATFDSLEQLLARMTQDVEQCREIIAADQRRQD
jgi:riboflavin kinase/FMN adenylyltransferase